MNLRNLSAGLLLAMLAVVLYSCKGHHACEGHWEGGGNRRSPQYASLNVNEDGTFSLSILPSRPDTYIKFYTGAETDFYGKWQAISENEIKLSSSNRTERFSNGQYEDFNESTTFYLRQDGAFCRNTPDFSSPYFDLMKSK